MWNGAYNSASGMMTALYLIDNIANNLSNISTPGYKRDKETVKTINYQNPQYNSSDFKTILNEQPALSSTKIDFSQGHIKTTGRNLDLALMGDGFFVLQSPDGKEFYTRRGTFFINRNYELVNERGMNVIDKAGKKIVLYGNEITFTDRGDIYVDGNYITTLKIVDFQDKNVLRKAGDSLFENTSKNPPFELQAPSVKQGALELSNVDIAKNIGEMIITLRSYEFQQRALDLFLTDITRRTLEAGSPV